MHSPEALILRRCFPVPVTFKDLRVAYLTIRWLFAGPRPIRAQASSTYGQRTGAQMWPDALKEVTSAIDEVYAVVDGREVRVCVVGDGRPEVSMSAGIQVQMVSAVDDLLDKADRAGYWSRPHEVRLDLQEWPISRETVAQAVLVGQQYLERSGDGGAA